MTEAAARVDKEVETKESRAAPGCEECRWASYNPTHEKSRSTQQRAAMLISPNYESERRHHVTSKVKLNVKRRHVDVASKRDLSMERPALLHPAEARGSRPAGSGAHPYRWLLARHLI